MKDSRVGQFEPGVFQGGRRRLLHGAGTLAITAVLPSGRVLADSRAAPQAEQDPALARHIDEAERALRGLTSVAALKMHIERSDFQREYDLVVLTDDRQEPGKVLIRLLGPALWRGNSTLKVGDRISFYDPRSRRITVMGSSMLSDQWMGSHFTNDDLMRETDLVRHYTYQLLGREPARDELDRDVQRLTIHLRPKPAAPVSWGRVVYQLQFREGEAALPLQVDYFRRHEDREAVRTLTYSRLGEMADRVLPQRLVMTAHDRQGEFTRIDYRKLSFDTDFGRDAFTEQALR